MILMLSLATSMNMISSRTKYSGAFLSASSTWLLTFISFVFKTTRYYCTMQLQRMGSSLAKQSMQVPHGYTAIGTVL